MMLTDWRIVQAHRIASAFAGEGARRYGGRWNHKGIPIVYAAGSLSLAALELLVHLESTQILRTYASIAIEDDPVAFQQNLQTNKVGNRIETKLFTQLVRPSS